MAKNTGIFFTFPCAMSVVKFPTIDKLEVAKWVM